MPGKRIPKYSDEEIADFIALTITDKSHCSIWPFKTRNGYPTHGEFYVRRFIYERFKEPIPKKLKIEAKCGNKLCINPDHLEASSMSDIISRSSSPITNTFLQRNKTHCKWGHEFNEDNTSYYITKEGKSQRVCKACHSKRFRRFKKMLRRGL